MDKFTIIIPTRQQAHLDISLESLKYAPDHNLHLAIKGNSWAEAVNIAFKEVTEGDVLLMDDDVVLLPETFEHLPRLYDLADMFGFLLLFPDYTIQHAGGIYFEEINGMHHVGYGRSDVDNHRFVAYVCHCTASLLFIKRHVIDRLKSFKEMSSGISHFSDCDFSFRALKAGFKILQVPSCAIHAESMTVRDKDINKKLEENRRELERIWLEKKEFRKVLLSYPQVIGHAERKVQPV